MLCPKALSSSSPHPLLNHPLFLGLSCPDGCPCVDTRKDTTMRCCHQLCRTSQQAPILLAMPVNRFPCATWSSLLLQSAMTFVALLPGLFIPPAQCAKVHRRLHMKPLSSLARSSPISPHGEFNHSLFFGRMKHIDYIES